MGKLEPPEGGTFLDGLEVRVAFGKVWKQSLSELSGGQRSLLALSLILALLLFKSAPLYILDEVDAALDLSHTQNIGRMIKAHFPHSQALISIFKPYLITLMLYFLKSWFDLKSHSCLLHKSSSWFHLKKECSTTPMFFSRQSSLSLNSTKDSNKADQVKC